MLPNINQVSFFVYIFKKYRKIRFQQGKAWHMSACQWLQIRCTFSCANIIQKVTSGLRSEQSRVVDGHVHHCHFFALLHALSRAIFLLHYFLFYHYERTVTHHFFIALFYYYVFFFWRQCGRTRKGIGSRVLVPGPVLDPTQDPKEPTRWTRDGSDH